MFEIEKNFNDPREFLSYFLCWNNDLRGFVFRGHADSEWKLTPTAIRNITLAGRRFYDEYNEEVEHDDYEQTQMLTEFHYLKEFYRMADLQGLRVPYSDYLRKNLSLEVDPQIFTILEGRSEWLPTELNDVAGLAQHYGIPTRLLDWTYDPFVAIYFALKGALDKDGDICIWCLNKRLLTSHSISYGNEIVRFVTPPYYDNPNLKAQKGLFTHVHLGGKLNGNNRLHALVDRRPLDEILRERLSSINHVRPLHIFKKITFPCKMARQAFFFLNDHGYGDAKIYPGYKGITEQLMNMGGLMDDEI